MRRREGGSIEQSIREKASIKENEKTISRFQIDFIKRQIGKLEEIKTREAALTPETKDIFSEIQKKKLSALEARGSARSLDTSEHILLAQALAAHAHSESSYQEYALNIDGLTGLNKEATLNDYLEHSQNAGVETAGFHFDIDHFKRFNDTYGHSAGDEVLRVAAKIFKEVRSTSGFAGRNHDKGEEFTMLFTKDQMTEDEQAQFNNDILALASHKAEEIRRHISEHVFTFIDQNEPEKGPVEEHVTASIGVAQMSEDETVRTFRNRMEQASVYAKKIGDGSTTRNQVALFNETINAWHQEQIRTSDSENKHAFDEVRGTDEFNVFEISLLHKAQIEFLESDLSDVTFSEESLPIFYELHKKLYSGNMPETQEFQDILNENGIIGTVEDVKELWYLYASLVETGSEFFGEQAKRDSLTGLYNRKEIGRRFTEALEKSIETGDPISIAILDMDHFKSKVNDIYGHAIGDVMLQEIGSFLDAKIKLLEQQLTQQSGDNFDGVMTIAKGRSFDDNADRKTKINGVSGRWGGEEFALLFPNMNAEETYEFINEYIITDLRNTEFEIDVDGVMRSIKATLSFGIIDNTIEAKEDLETEMLNKADIALYACKLRGRDQASIYSKELHEEVKQAVKKQQTDNGDKLR